MMPLAWTKYYRTAIGKARVFMTTMGASQGFQDEGFRRMVVNACFWWLGLEDRTPSKANVDLVGTYFLLRLQNSGVDFVWCDCPNADRFTVGILALVAERERELIPNGPGWDSRIRTDASAKLKSIAQHQQFPRPSSRVPAG